MQKESGSPMETPLHVKESDNAMETPFSSKRNGVEMEVWPPLDLHYVPFDTIFISNHHHHELYTFTQYGRQSNW